MLGGVPVMVSGPIFGKSTDNIRLSLDNVEVVCSRLNAEKALCVTPFLNKAGKVNAELTVNSIKHKRTAIYYSSKLNSIVYYSHYYHAIQCSSIRR